MTSSETQSGKRVKVFLPIYGLDGGGAERVVLTLARHLDRDRFEPVIVLLYAGGDYLTQVGPDVRVIELYKEAGTEIPQGGQADGSTSDPALRQEIRTAVRDLLPPTWVEHYRRWKQTQWIRALYAGKTRVRKSLGSFLRTVRRKRILNRYLEDYGVWRYIKHSEEELRARFEPLIEKEAPDAIVSHLLLANYVNLRVSTRPEVFKAVCIHNTLKDYQSRVEYQKSPLGKADRILTVSKAIGEIHAKKHGDEKVRPLYNPHDIRRIRNLAQEPVTDPWFRDKDRPLLVGIGRLCRQKNFRLLVDAVACLNRREERSIRLALFGEGPERARLLRQIRKQGQEDRIRLMGWVPNPFRYLARADLFVLCSDWEGLPNTMIEAMACGVPVIGTDCQSGAREILNGGECGLLIRCGDPKGLRQAIRQVLENPEEARILRERGLRRAWDFDIPARLPPYEKLILEGVEEKRTRSPSGTSPSLSPTSRS